MKAAKATIGGVTDGHDAKQEEKIDTEAVDADEMDYGQKAKEASSLLASSPGVLLLDCFQHGWLAFGLLSAPQPCFWIAFSPPSLLLDCFQHLRIGLDSDCFLDREAAQGLLQEAGSFPSPHRTKGARVPRSPYAGHQAVHHHPATKLAAQDRGAKVKLY